MTPTLLAAVSAVIGIVVGKLWEVHSESSRWRRDERTRSYQCLAEVFREVYEDIRTVALAEFGSAGLAEAVDRARQDSRWDNALAVVWLHGSPAVVIAATRIDRAITDLFYDAQDRMLSIEDWNRARVTSREEFERFIAAARDDLDLPPVSVRFFADGHDGSGK
jgi:hypothetical protein